MDLPSDDVRTALYRLAEDPDLLEDLCDPWLGRGASVEVVPSDLVAPLAAAGIVAIHKGTIHPRLWVKLRAGRPYLMSTTPRAADDDYPQEVWPETEASLAYLATLPSTGTLLDIATGSGVIAIEAALRGHRATATEIYPSVLGMAAWNAALHRADVELALGDMYAPVAGRRFDLVVATPTYSGPYGMLRVEALRDGLAHVAPGGALFMATFLEWQPGERPGLVESFLAPLAERAAVRVLPIRATTLRNWFAVPTRPGFVARHRFTVEVRPDGPPGLTLELPGDDAETDVIVPLTRLIGPRADRAAVRAEAVERSPLAVITAADRDALEALLTACADGVITLDTPVPYRLLDACRLGVASCLDSHEPIVDVAGGVRPCTHGAPIVRIDDDDDTYRARMVTLVAEAEARRGCAVCPAARVCSRCVFPAFLDEQAYCDLVRRRASALPILRRLLWLQQHVLQDLAGEPRASIKLRPGGPLVAAAFRPDAPTARAAGDEALVWIQDTLLRYDAALVVTEDVAVLHLATRGERYTVGRGAADVIELAYEGTSKQGLMLYAADRGLPFAAVEMTIWCLGSWLAS